MNIPIHPLTFADILKSLNDPIHGPRLVEVLTLGIGPAPGGKYRHWDTLRHIKPPDGLSSEEWWAGIKFARFPARREAPLLGHALRHPGMRYTIESHKTSHRITYQTARADLLGLVTQQLLHQRKVARAFVFTVPPDLTERVQKLSSE